MGLFCRYHGIGAGCEGSAGMGSSTVAVVPVAWTAGSVWFDVGTGELFVSFRNANSGLSVSGLCLSAPRLMVEVKHRREGFNGGAGDAVQEARS